MTLHVILDYLVCVFYVVGRNVVALVVLWKGSLCLIVNKTFSEHFLNDLPNLAMMLQSWIIVYFW